mgnify:CR=1 FL=1
MENFQKVYMISNEDLKKYFNNKRRVSKYQLEEYIKEKQKLGEDVNMAC